MISSWPTYDRYNEAIQHPQYCFDHPELKAGTVKTNSMGLPIPITGRFAIVYEINTPKKNFAVRCFSTPVTNHRRRYDLFSQHIRDLDLPMMTDFVYQTKGIVVGGKWYPIVWMEWVSGKLLDQYITTNLTQPRKLNNLLIKWRDMLDELGKHQIAHGDLQHQNILIDDNSEQLRLVDFDGVYIPALRDDPPGENGNLNYQHPERIQKGYYAVNADNFSGLVIYLSILALIKDPSLWQYNYSENLIFSHTDFRSPSTAPLWKRLMAIPDAEVQYLTGELAKYCNYPVSAVPDLKTLLQTPLKPLPSPSLTIQPTPINQSTTYKGQYSQKTSPQVLPMVMFVIFIAVIAGLLLPRILNDDDINTEQDIDITSAETSFAQIYTIESTTAFSNSLKPTITPSEQPSSTSTLISTLLATTFNTPFEPTITPTVTFTVTPTTFPTSLPTKTRTPAPTQVAYVPLNDLWVVFAGRYEDSNRDGSVDNGDFSNLYIMQADGSQRRQLTSGYHDSDPTVSPDNQRIVFTRRNSDSDFQMLFVMNTDGSNVHRLVADDGYTFAEPSWSPDGSQITAACNHYFICMVNIARGQVSVFLEGDVSHIYWDVNWSPDGSELVMLGRTEDTGGQKIGEVDPCDFSNLFLINTDGSQLRQLTFHNDGSVYGPSWSPNGEQIAYVIAYPACDFNVRAKMMITDLAGNKTTVTDGSGWVRQPSWSPDGRYLLFVRAVDDTNKDGEINAIDFEELVVYDTLSGDTLVLEGDQLEHFDPTWLQK